MSYKYGMKVLRYEGDINVPSVIFGGGNIKVTSYMDFNSDGFIGLSFSEVKKAKKVGFYDESNKGEIADYSKIDLQFLFDNKDSIDVVISQLEKIKEEFK